MGKVKKKKSVSAVQDQITRNFLSLFRLQLGAPKNHPAKLEFQDSEASDNTTTYQMTVEWQGQVNSKRMTIGHLGDNSGGRSLCFKVIYDDILVVKVPANPIRHFSSYVAGIASEKRITKKVDRTIPCVVPSVAAMVRRIPAFSPFKTNDPDQMERAAIRWLETYASYQSYVQIEGTYIYVMELSENQFLSQALADIHDVSTLFEVEMSQQLGLTMDFADFENRYGQVDVSVWLGVNTVYAEFERLVQKTRLQSDPHKATLPDYRVRELFGSWLTQTWQKNIQPKGEDPAEKKLQALYRGLKDTYGTEIRAYFKIVKARMQKRAFDRNQQSMGVIVSQLVDLLAKLEHINLVVRDLKPDNLFLSQQLGEVDFVNKTDVDFGIGLIDLETAVLVPQDPEQPCRQPLLGGTPPYATPLNFAKNKMLAHFYPDIIEVLKLQDWYAVVALIFRVVVGKPLFRNAGRSIVSIVDIFQSHDLGRRTFGQALKKGSRMFWSIAVEDFTKGMSLNENRLRQVNVTLSNRACKTLQNRIRGQHKRIEKKYNDLLRAASKSLTPQDFSLSIKKNHRRLRQQVKLYQFFDQYRPKMTAYQLMHFMFNIVFRNFYFEKWGKLINVPASKFDKSLRDVTIEITSKLRR